MVKEEGSKKETVEKIIDINGESRFSFSLITDVNSPEIFNIASIPEELS